MKRLGSIALLLLAVFGAAAQTKPVSERAAATAMTALWRDNGGYPAKWTYDRAELVAILNRLAQAVAKYQEPRSALWYQVLDKGGEKGNYLESSAACMFVYALAKGVRNGYLPRSYRRVAEKGYRGILKEFVKTDASDQLNLEGTVSVAGLGGNPYRDGSYEYYLSEKVVTNDPKGIGALLLAATEMETAAKRHKRVSYQRARNERIKR